MDVRTGSSPLPSARFSFLREPPWAVCRSFQLVAARCVLSSRSLKSQGRRFESFTGPFSPSPTGTWSRAAPIGISGSRSVLASNSRMIRLRCVAVQVWATPTHLVRALALKSRERRSPNQTEPLRSSILPRQPPSGPNEPVGATHPAARPLLHEHPAPIDARGPTEPIEVSDGTAASRRPIRG